MRWFNNYVTLMTILYGSFWCQYGMAARQHHSTMSLNDNNSTKVPARKQYKIRVLLSNFFAKPAPQFLRVECKNNVTIDGKTTSSNHHTPQQGPFFIALFRDTIYLSYGPEHTTEQYRKLRLQFSDNHFVLNGTPYQGNLTLTFNTKKKPLIINTVPLDDYIYSVLRFEIFQSWPMEMQKVQAVASRTYVLHHLISARKRKKPYDVASNNLHQCYNGHHQYDHLRQAVRVTQRVVVTHNNKLALTMFDACCGGIKPAHMKTTLFEKAPYLARKKRCHHCRKCAQYTWKRELTAQKLLSLLAENAQIKKQLRTFGKLMQVTIFEEDQAGIVHTVRLKGTRTNIHIKSKTFLSLLRPYLKSLCFSIFIRHKKNQPVKIVFKGSGFGHLIGLCQRGAKELVQHGWNYRRILAFYYPYTRIKRLG